MQAGDARDPGRETLGEIAGWQNCRIAGREGRKAAFLPSLSAILQSCHSAMSAKSEAWDEMAVVGRIARAHGRRGQVIINLETDFPEARFYPGAEVFVAREGSAAPLTLTTVRFQHDRPVVGIAGVDTMNDAEALAGQELRVPRAWLAPLPKDTFYRHDLVGCQVETSQRSHQQVQDRLGACCRCADSDAASGA